MLGDADFDFTDPELRNVRNELSQMSSFYNAYDEYMGLWDPDNADPLPAIRDHYKAINVDINRYIPLDSDPVDPLPDIFDLIEEFEQENSSFSVIAQMQNPPRYNDPQPSVRAGAPLHWD